MKTMNHYDTEKKNRANLHATLRGVVALYLIYIAQKLVRNVSTGTTTMPAWAAWLIGAAFVAAAVGFGVYAWRAYRKDLVAAKMSDESESGEDA